MKEAQVLRIEALNLVIDCVKQGYPVHEATALAEEFYQFITKKSSPAKKRRK